MITSRLSAKSQTTIPQAVRKALDLNEGDDIAYVIEGGHVILKRATADIFSNPFSLFTEWDSEEDEKGYAHL